MNKINKPDKDRLKNNKIVMQKEEIKFLKLLLAVTIQELADMQKVVDKLKGKEDNNEGEDNV